MADNTNTTGAPPSNLPTADSNSGEGGAPQKDPKKFDEAASDNLNKATAPVIEKNQGKPYGGTDTPAPAADIVKKDYNAVQDSPESGGGSGIPGTNEEEILKELSKSGGGGKKIVLIVAGVLVLILVVLLIVLLVTRGDSDGSAGQANDTDFVDVSEQQTTPPPPAVGPTLAERDLQRVTDVRRIQGAIRTFYGPNGREPTSLSELVPQYLDTFPVGPNGENYFYSYSSDGQHYHIGALLEDSFHGALLTDDDFDSRFEFVGGFNGEDPMFDLSQ